MPRSKHRRKTGGKAVAHPGRGKQGRPLRIDWPDESRRLPDVSDLPLWQAADTAELEAETPRQAEGTACVGTPSSPAG